MPTRAAILASVLLLAAAPAADVIRSAKSGPWSDGATWTGGVVPGAGAKVLVRPGHSVVYDAASDQAIRSLHIGGTLRFATDRNTRLDVGLIKIQPGEECVEDGFNCDVHLAAPETKDGWPALEVGSADQPVEAGKTALIRLVYFDGMDKETCPAIISCAGRMEFHGAPMNRTWVKLGATAKPGDSEIALSEPVTGWKAGDRVILTATSATRTSRARAVPASATARSSPRSGRSSRSTPRRSRSTRPSNSNTSARARPAARSPT
jgi:hypothetical protein